MLGQSLVSLDGRGKLADLASDVVMFDAPATGHGLDMLRVPKVIVEIAPPGCAAQRCRARLGNVPRSGAQRSGGRDLAGRDANQRIARVCARRCAMSSPCRSVKSWSTRCFRRYFPKRTRARSSSSVRARAGRERAQCSTVVCARAIRERIQNESLTRLTELGVPLRKLELLLDGAATSDAVLGLSRNFRRVTARARQKSQLLVRASKGGGRRGPRATGPRRARPEGVV